MMRESLTDVCIEDRLREMKKVKWVVWWRWMRLGFRIWNVESQLFETQLCQWRMNLLPVIIK
jgi:hypothetical protein